MSYGPNIADLYRRAADLRRPILKRRQACRPPGRAARPNSNSSINLKTAKALGLDVPPTLLARADEVIE